MRVIFRRFIERHVRAAAFALCAACVAYFYLLDHAVFSSAHFSPIFSLLLKTYDLQVAWLALAVCLLGILWSRPEPVLRFVDFIGQHPKVIALAVSVALAIGALIIYHNYPLSMDEYAAVFQSKIFASGNLAAQVPPNLVDWLVVRGFNGSFLIASMQTGRVIAAYWPGFAMLLAPFQFFGMPWLCNAFLSGFAIFLIYWLTREITASRRAAGWAMLFAAASGAFVAQGISYYSMQAHLAANLLFAALLVRPSGNRAFGAGVVGSVALILHNPVPHALFAIPWIAALASQADQRRHLLPLLVGYIPGVALGIGWLFFRIEIGSNGLGLGAVSGVASGVFAWPDIVSLNNRTAALVKMCVWATPSLFALALLGCVIQRSDSRVRRLAYSAILTFVGYIFVRFDQGHGWGYRYFHSAWGAIPILAGCAMSEIVLINRRVIAFAGATAILSLLLVIPMQMSQIEHFISGHLAQLAKPKRPGNNVYFIHPLGGFYLADMIQFDPLLRNQDLMLVSHGAALDEEFVRRNWPVAIKLSDGRAAKQWYLGMVDQRQTTSNNEESRFVIAQIPR